MNIPEEVWRSMEAHLCRLYPEEGCGVILGEKASGALGPFVPIRNIQDLLHAQDPHRYPRSAQTGYEMDPGELLRMEEKWQQTHRIAGMVHSHIDRDVYFSDEDTRMAAPFGEALFPDRFYLILSVTQRGVQHAGAFAWDVKAKQFMACDLEIEKGV